MSQDMISKSGGVAALHARASSLVMCLHDVIGHLVYRLDDDWGYGPGLFELSRDELLQHSKEPWNGMKSALERRRARQEPWNALGPQELIWPSSPTQILSESKPESEAGV